MTPDPSQEPLWLRVTFLVGASMLFTHELDAMTHAEWRVLPLTSWLETEIGRVVFVAAHVPAFALILGWLTSRVPGRVQQAQFWIAILLVIHAVLHAMFASHPAYSFEGLLSNTLIFGAGGLGLIYALGRARARQS